MEQCQESGDTLARGAVGMVPVAPEVRAISFSQLERLGGFDLEGDLTLEHIEELFASVRRAFGRGARRLENAERRRHRALDVRCEQEQIEPLDRGRQLALLVA